jgi:hypothetical protein
MTPKKKSRSNHGFCKTAGQEITHQSTPGGNHATPTLITLPDKTAGQQITHQITLITRLKITFPTVPLGTGERDVRATENPEGATE